jgi:hypothetical protein
MLKAVISYSKKIPVPGSEFSSQGFSLSLETEITDTQPAAIQARLHETYELVKATVEQELAKGNGRTAAQPETGAEAAPRAAPTGDKASNKQVKFITDLATQRGLSLSDLNARVSQRFGVAGLYDLDKKQASSLLDELNGKQRKAA